MAKYKEEDWIKIPGFAQHIYPCDRCYKKHGEIKPSKFYLEKGRYHGFLFDQLCGQCFYWLVKNG